MTGNPMAGWYPDPTTPGQVRYWDGATWTTHTAPVPGELGADAPPWAAPTSAAPRIGSHRLFHDIGDWLKESFRTLFKNWKQTVVLNLLTIPVWLAVAVLAIRGGSEVSVAELDKGNLVGLRPGWLVAAVILAVVGVLLGFACRLALARVYYANPAANKATGSADLSAMDGLRAGLRRVLPTVVIMIALNAVAIVLLAALVLAAFAVSTMGTGLTVAFVVLIALPLLIAGGVWAWVRLGFLRAALALAPRVSDAFRISMDLSRGRFWALLGRFLLLALVLWGVGLVFGIPQQLAFGVGGGSLFVSTDAALANSPDGDTIGELYGWMLSTMLGEDVSLLTFGAIVLFGMLGSAAQTALRTTAMSLLYRDLGGESDLAPVQHGV